MTEFDPLTHIRFRGRPIDDLSREEMKAALLQALTELYRRDAPPLLPWPWDTPQLQEPFNG